MNTRDRFGRGYRIAAGALALVASAHCSTSASPDAGAGASDAASASESGGDATGTSEASTFEAGTREGGAAVDAGSAEAGRGNAGSNDAGAAPPSCQSTGPGLTDCGPDHESCCASSQVTGGEFDRTYGTDGGGATDPATVSTFRLDKYLVTVGRFRRFVAAWNGGAGYTPSAGAGKHSHVNGGKGLVDIGGDAGAYETGWLSSDDGNVAPTNDNLACDPVLATWTSAPGSQESLPINCINWWEAYAFCIWDDGFLPSEAEFEYAAAGGTEQRDYPWGSAPPGTVSQYAIYGCNFAEDGGGCAGTPNIAPVGSATAGAGRWGQLDLSGDMEEWLLDWNAPYVSPCSDCAFVASGSGRVDRGGDFSGGELLLQSSNRNEGLYPTDRYQTGGFRCARTP